MIRLILVNFLRRLAWRYVNGVEISDGIQGY